MRNYTTQMDAARKGIVTPEIEKVAEKEHMSTEALMKLVGEGKVAIPANKKHTCLNPEGVGSVGLPPHVHCHNVFPLQASRHWH